MFGLTKKTEYGLQLMVYLGQNLTPGPVSLKQVAKEQKLPHRFLSQVARSLKKAHLISSKEGLGGGYFLTRSPQQISVSQIVEVLEGPLELVECLRGEACCSKAGACGQKRMFEQMGKSVNQVMSRYVLADLIPESAK
ncbi:Rrf2 family transcriptional regulator [Patescibacteria group bacterium]|nr:Rrf2 family transcriptional regulator [Patescibacteria group bacterium]